MGVRSQGQEDPLEERMETHSSILAWRIPWTEEIGYYPLGCRESDTTETTEHTCTLTKTAHLKGQEGMVCSEQIRKECHF